jgi:hypothetical protein
VCGSGVEAGDFDHSQPELINKLKPIVCICYHADYLYLSLDRPDVVNAPGL